MAKPTQEQLDHSHKAALLALRRWLDGKPHLWTQPSSRDAVFMRVLGAGVLLEVFMGSFRPDWMEVGVRDAGSINKGAAMGLMNEMRDFLWVQLPPADAAALMASDAGTRH